MLFDEHSVEPEPEKVRRGCLIPAELFVIAVAVIAVAALVAWVAQIAQKI